MAEGDFPERQVSAAEAHLARADLLAGAQSAAEYQKLLAGHEKVRGSRRRARPAGPARGPHRRSAHEFRRRRGGRQHQRALLHRVRQAGTRQRQGRAGAAQGRRHQPEARRAVRPHGRSATPIRASASCTGRPPPSAIRAIPPIGNRSPKPTWPSTITAKPRKAWRSGEQAATDPVEREKYAPRAHARSSSSAWITRRPRSAARPRRRRAKSQKLKTAGARRTAQGRSQIQRSARPWAAINPCRGGTGPSPRAKCTGTLKQVDCLPKQQARLFVEDAAHKLVKLLVADPSKVVYMGNGEVVAGLRRAEAAQGQPSSISRKPTPGWPPPARLPPSTSSDPARHSAKDGARYRWVVLAVFVLSTAINYPGPRHPRRAGARS